MARPQKRGLDYFPRDTDYYNDYKIMALLERYGPMGHIVYDALLCLIYRNGYYLAIPLDQVAFQIMRMVGNRWIKDKSLVLNVIHYCADIGLIDDGLLSQNVITSSGIQRRYAEVTVRNKVDKSLYWLLKKEQPSESTPKNHISVAETGVSVTETLENVSETPTKKKKENKRKEIGAGAQPHRFHPPTLEQVKSYCKERGNTVNPEAFVNFYESKGWMVGKNRMKDWKAAVRTWEQKEKPGSERRRRILD